MRAEIRWSMATMASAPSRGEGERCINSRRIRHSRKLVGDSPGKDAIFACAGVAGASILDRIEAASPTMATP